MARPDDAPLEGPSGRPFNPPALIRRRARPAGARRRRRRPPSPQPPKPPSPHPAADKGKAAKAAKAVTKSQWKKARKPRYSVIFHRPKTLVRARDPKVPRVR